MININARIDASPITVLSDIGGRPYATKAVELVDPCTFEIQMYSHLSGCDIRAYHHSICYLMWYKL